jgi:sigma-54 specific flagellar transcriptional regulator A
MTKSIDSFITGQSSAMMAVKNMITMVAPSSTTVLVLGETGTGKEMVSQAIHHASNRKGKLVSVNCAAIPSELLESELFGHEKGAFTGADRPREGRFELASGGTLFLDEIGDMPLSLQSKLLRALEDRTIQRVGGGKDISVDFRLICATHQNLKNKVDDGSFRADLYYRINVFPLQLPSLAERKVDVPMLIEEIMATMRKRGDVADFSFDDEAIAELMRYSWPGNVRELRNVLERASVLFSSKTISADQVRENLIRMKAPKPEMEAEFIWNATADLGEPPQITEDASSRPPLPHSSDYRNWFEYFDDIDLRRHLQDIEITLIEAALDKHDGLVSHAADALKLRRTTLIEKMRKHLIEKPQAPAEQ